MHFITGMALGTDMYAAEIVIELAKSNSDIKLSAYIPCRNQSEKWSFLQKRRYDKIIRRCNDIVVLEEAYTQDCMQKRNRIMVDKSDCIIAVWDGTPSGTGSTVKYAKYRNKNIILINPFDL